MPKGVREVIEEVIEKEMKELSVFRRNRSVAIQSALIAFELVVTDLFAMDDIAMMMNESVVLPHATQRKIYEDAICAIVPETWQRCQSSGNYDTRIDAPTIRDGMDALNSFARFCTARNQLFETRFGEIRVEMNESKVRFFQEGGIPKRHPRRWIREVQAEIEGGAEGVQKMDERLQRKPASNADLWHAFYLSTMQSHGFTEDVDIGGYNIGQYLWFWSGFNAAYGQKVNQNRANSVAARSGSKFSPRDSIWIVREQGLVNRIADAARLQRKIVEIILRDLVYSGKAHQSSVYLRPFVPIGGSFLAFTPHQVMLSEKLRNLRQRLALTKPKLYDRIQPSLSKRMVDALSFILRSRGFLVTQKKVKDSSGNVLTDIDLLARSGNLVIAIQVKNINPPDSYEENIRAFNEVAKAEYQMRLSINFLKTNWETVLDLLEVDEASRDQVRPPAGLIVTGITLQYAPSEPKWPYVDFREFDEAIARIETGRTAFDESVNELFGYTTGHFAIGELEFEVEVGTPEGGGTLEMNQYVNSEIILQSLKWD